MDRGKYFNKCLPSLNIEQFEQIQKNLTRFLEKKVELILRKT